MRNDINDYEDQILDFYNEEDWSKNYTPMIDNTFEDKSDGHLYFKFVDVTNILAMKHRLWKYTRMD